jgi:ABC-type lipoprotein export system ATPase subunit
MQITCRDLVKRYPLADREVGALNGVSFELTSGELTVVVGRSGSGKTTLLNALGGLERPTSGTVVIDGEDLYARGDRELSRYRNERVGFVFQSFHLNGAETALENVLVPFLFSQDPPPDPEERARQSLKAVDLGEQSDQPAGTLSAGQRQRVAIARALVNRPDFVLADEPTGNLDEETGAGIVDRLEGLAREHGLGVVIVTHDPAITALADRVLKLERGRLVE